MLIRLLLRELVGPFLLALALLGCLMTTGFVLFNLIEESVRFQIPPQLFAQILLLRLPEMLFYTLPMSILMATLLAFSRLSVDQELLTLRMLGYSFFRLLAPVLALSGVLTLLTISLNETLVPPSVFAARQALEMARNQQLQPVPQRQEQLVYRQQGQQGLAYLLYAGVAEGGVLQDVVVQHFKNRQLAFVLQAQQARWQGQEWIFEKGQVLRWQGPERWQELQFDHYQLQVFPSLSQVLSESRQPLEMNLSQLTGYIQALSETGQKVQALRVRWHQKLTIPCAALVFCLLGAVLGAQTLRGVSQPFGLTIALVFGYYVLMALGTAWGDLGYLPPWLAAWLPNVVGAGAGGWLAVQRNNA